MEELKDHRADRELYPGSGYQGPTSSSLSIFVRERFGRRSLDADPRLISGEVFSLSERRKMMEMVEELSVLLSGWLCSQCRAQAVSW
jgi:hypothetical protein